MAEESEIEEKEEQPVSKEEQPASGVKTYKCPYCGKVYDTLQGYAGHIRMHKREKELEEEAKEAEEEEEEEKEEEAKEEKVEIPKPYEVEVLEEVYEFLKERLPQIYGIEKYSKLIINALRDNPAPLRDANTLHAFIKSLAPRVYDQHLTTFVITPLYAKFPNLPQIVDEFLSKTRPSTHMQYIHMPPAGPSYTVYQPYPYYYGAPAYYYGYQQMTPQYAPPPPYPVYSDFMMHERKLPAEKRKKKKYVIEVDGVQLKVDEMGYLLWKRYLDERKEREEARKKGEEEHIVITVGDKEVKVPMSIAAAYYLREMFSPTNVNDLVEKRMKEIEERLKEKIEEISKKVDSLAEGKGSVVEEKIEELSKKVDELRHEREEERIKKLEARIEALERRPSFFEQLQHYDQAARMLGYQKVGRTTLDVLAEALQNLNERAKQLLEKIPPGGGYTPEIKRSVIERAEKAEEILRRLEKSEEILRAEDELLKAATKVKPRVFVGEQGARA